MKPNCLLLKSLLADMCFTIVSLTSFSMVLQITLVGDRSIVRRSITPKVH
jgi:hypothetical protein